MRKSKRHTSLREEKVKAKGCFGSKREFQSLEKWELPKGHKTWKPK